MNTFTIHTSDTAPEQSRTLLNQVADNIGFAPNIFAVTAESTPALSGLIAVNEAFEHSSFTSQEQQVILMATSVENSCVYCVAGHTLMAKGLNIPEEVISALRNQESLNHPRYGVLYRTVIALIQDRGRIDEAVLSAFLEVGYSKAQFLELIMGICVKTFTNYVSNALNLTVDDAFAPYRWQRPDDLQESA